MTHEIINPQPQYPASVDFIIQAIEYIASGGAENAKQSLRLVSSLRHAVERITARQQPGPAHSPSENQGNSAAGYQRWEEWILATEQRYYGVVGQPMWERSQKASAEFGQGGTESWMNINNHYPQPGEASLASMEFSDDLCDLSTWFNDLNTLGLMDFEGQQYVDPGQSS